MDIVPGHEVIPALNYDTSANIGNFNVPNYVVVRTSGDVYATPVCVMGEHPFHDYPVGLDNQYMGLDSRITENWPAS